jgi:hypothetical protein
VFSRKSANESQPSLILNQMVECGEQDVERDSEQTIKYLEFMNQDLPKPIEVGKNLLRSMEVLDDEMKLAEECLREQSELSEELVKKLENAKQKEPRIGLCQNGKKAKENKWRPTLVERQRRTKNNGDTMLHKAMNLKQRKNLDVKGNSFSVLQFESLNQIVVDVNLKIGSDNNETNRIIDNLVESKKLTHGNFVSENPETNLPSNLDVEMLLDGSSTPVEGSIARETHVTPEASLKEPDSSELWTEVVKRGRYKNKNRSKQNKIDSYDRSILKC